MPSNPLDFDNALDRERMVTEQLAARGITSERVLDALRRVPRHRFIPPASESFARAYCDSAQPIGDGQTISQPYIVALMSQALALTGDEKVLEIGAGSGYQTAVLSLLAREVVAVERIEPLAQSAGRNLAGWGLAQNVRLFFGDGSRGWNADAPYDAILVAAAAPTVPQALLLQLKPGGRLVLPVGQEGAQRLLLLVKPGDGSPTFVTYDLGGVAFVPLVGAGGFGMPDDLGAMDI